MKKSKKLRVIAVLILAIATSLLVYLLYSDRPFEAMDENEIEKIIVYAIPPDEEVVLSEAEVESFVPLLQNLKISKPGYKIFAMGMGGQTIRFTVQELDGSTTEISNVGNVLIIVDGKSYQADYESAEAINEFANKVLKTGF